MSKEKTKSEILTHKNDSLKVLDNYMNDLIESDPKKVDLLSYWLHTYTNYLKFEKTFEPSRNKKYNRGDIIQVNLGFNIGSEHGGLHYAVVLDNNNEKNSPIITIIPLSSSDGTDVHSSEVYLGDDIYQKLRNKINGMLQAYKNELKEIQNLQIILDSNLDNLKKHQTDMTPEEFDVQLNLVLSNTDILTAKKKSLLKKQQYLQKCLLEVGKMKRGSIALVRQITTISKIRIVDPKNTHGVLNGIKLSTENLDKINDKIKSTFLFEHT